jgi:hypothetical protein
MIRCLHKRLQLCNKILLCSGILLLSGCAKLIDWGKQSFNQGTDLDNNRAFVQQYMRAISVYDQLSTQARFAALWLNDAVRIKYAQLYARSHGSSQEPYQALVRRQLDENKKFITFYVLSFYDISLGEPDSKWSLFLRINDTTLMPIDIKLTDLPPEYKFFFGKELTSFRNAYRIIFDAKNIEDKCILDASTQLICLYFRSAHKQMVLQWEVSADLLHCTPEDFKEGT